MCQLINPNIAVFVGNLCFYHLWKQNNRKENVYCIINVHATYPYFPYNNNKNNDTIEKKVNVSLSCMLNK